MKEKINHSDLLLDKKESGDKIKFPGDLPYPASEDIYNQSKKEEEIDPENIAMLKTPNETETGDRGYENELTKIISPTGLDIPGSELDDQQEEIGSEDEENNYYSLGGDNHNDLEESKEV